MANGDVTEFSAKVPTPEFERFRGAFPQYGATSWFINTALKAFNDRVEKSPEIRKLVDNAIEDILELNRELSIFKGGKSE